MSKEHIYNEPEFKAIKYKNQDVISTSGDFTPPWGGQIVNDPEFPEIEL